jgi:hypothetical protein
MGIETQAFAAASSVAWWSVDIAFSCAWCMFVVTWVRLAFQSKWLDATLALAAQYLVAELHSLHHGTSRRVMWLVESVASGACDGVAWLARSVGMESAARVAMHVRDLWRTFPIFDHVLVRVLLCVVLAVLLFNAALELLMQLNLDPRGVPYRARAALFRWCRPFWLDA